MILPRLKIGNEKGSLMPVYIQDRYTHTLLMGKSGAGKSTSISNWWEQDHHFGNAKILIDPSGFLAKDCYSISRGIYCSLDHPVAINPMKAPYTDSQISDIIAESINQVISITTPNQPFTAKMRAIIDNSIKWCLKNDRKSLLNVLDHVKNLSGDKETRDGIIARLSFLLSDEKMVSLLCGNDSVEWGELIAKRQTFILDCFGMSKDKMVFVGSIVTNGIKNYFRYARPKEYLPISLYLDECQNFINPSLFDILKEGRKYKLSACLSTQDFAVIDDRMVRVMLNVGNIASYRLGRREASLVAGELDFAPQDLQFLEMYHIAYLTPQERGIAKAPRPPLFKQTKPPKNKEIRKKSTRLVWFTLEPYPKKESVDAAQERAKKGGPIADKKQAKQEESLEAENTSRHRYLQNLIKRMAEEKGFRVTEQVALDGLKKVDMTFEGDGGKIACKIASSATDEHSAEDIKKCLTDGYEKVIICSPLKRILDNIKAMVWKKIDVVQQEKILFLRPEDMFFYLEEKAAILAGKEGRVKRYKVKVNYRPVAEEEKNTRREAVGQVILQALKRMREE